MLKDHDLRNVIKLGKKLYCFPDIFSACATMIMSMLRQVMTMTFSKLKSPQKKFLAIALKQGSAVSDSLPRLCQSYFSYFLPKKLHL